MDNRLDISEVTPEMAQKELARRELARRQAAREKPPMEQRMAPKQLKDINMNTTSADVLPRGGMPAEIGKKVLEGGAGFTQGLANIPSGIANLGVSGANALGANIPKVPSFDYAPDTAASSVGNALSFLTPGSLLKMLGKAPQLAGFTRSAMSMPLIAKGLKHAGDIFGKSPFLTKTAGNAVLGGAYNPEHPLLGAAAGATIPAVEKTGKALYDAGKAVVSGVTPKVLAQTVQASHDALEKEAANLFTKVGSQAKARGVDKVPVDIKLIDTISPYLPQTRASTKLIEDAKTGDYQALRKMQSELWHRGTSAAENKLPSERNKGEELLDLRDRINESISKHFEKTGNKDLSELLLDAKNKYRTLKKTYFSKKMAPAIKNLVHSESRKVPKNIVNVVGEDSVPMERLRNANPLIRKNLNILQGKENAISTLKKLGIGAGITGGILSLPSGIRKAASFLGGE